MSTPARDDFSGASGSLGAPNWAQQSSAGNVARDGSGRAIGTTGGGLARRISDTFNAAHYSQASVIGGLAAGTSLVEIETRASGLDATLSAYLAYTDGTSGGAGLQKYVNAVLSPVRTYTGTIASGKYRLESRGTTHEAFIGDVSLGTATDSSLTTGAPGLAVVGTAIADDWEGGNYGAASDVAPLRVPMIRPLRRIIGRAALALRAPQHVTADPGTVSLPGLNIDSSQSVGIGGSAAVAVLAQLTSSQGVPIGGTATATVLDQVASTQPVPVGGSATIGVLDQVASTQPVPVSGAATIAVAEQVTSSQSVAPGGSIAVSVLDQLSSTKSVPIGGAVALGVAVQVTSVQAVPIGGSIGASVLVQITSTQQIPIGGIISMGSGAIVTSTASVLIGGSIAASVLDQLASSVQILIGGSASVSVLVKLTSAVPVPISGLIAAALGVAASSTVAVPVSGSIAVSVVAPFTGTHLDEPLSIDFTSLATALDFDSLATAVDFASLETEIEFTPLTTAIDFSSLESMLVFLDGGHTVFELTIIQGEVATATMVLRGADPVTQQLVPYDLSAASSLKLNAGKAGGLIINNKTLTPVDAVHGKVSYTNDPTESAVPGRFDALAVATFPGTPNIVRKFPGRIVVENAIA
jgi:hypothetical protein